MQRRKLGELEVSAVGLGCATMTPFYGEPDPDAALATLERAPEIGVDFLDTSDAYGQGRNEELIARALRGHRDRYVVATKFGNMGRNFDGSAAGDGRPEYVRLACERSLARLGIEVIDLYYIHRVDPRVPTEDTVGAMSELVREGKVRFLGISEAGAETIRRAHAVHPMTAVQIEYSLWSREVEDSILPLCQKLGIGFVAYSPLGRGFLTGTVAAQDDLGANDARRHMPRFEAENLRRNLALVAALRRLAAEMKRTPAQLAIAWVLSRGDIIVPIPGTSHKQRIEENAADRDRAVCGDAGSARRDLRAGRRRWATLSPSLRANPRDLSQDATSSGRFRRGDRGSFTALRTFAREIMPEFAGR
jgi:aryl-alcohol dehydrogenase-like predicted oxidoreductase